MQLRYAYSTGYHTHSGMKISCANQLFFFVSYRAIITQPNIIMSFLQFLWNIFDTPNLLETPANINHKHLKSGHGQVIAYNVLLTQTIAYPCPKFKSGLGNLCWENSPLGYISRHVVALPVHATWRSVDQVKLTRKHDTQRSLIKLLIRWLPEYSF